MAKAKKIQKSKSKPQSSKTKRPAGKPKNTLGVALASLDLERINQIKEHGVQETILNVRNLVAGVVQAYSAPATDTSASVDRQRLEDAGMTTDKVTALAQGALKLIEDAEDKQLKEQALHVATVVLKTDREANEQQMAQVHSRMRGSFGNTSSDLKKFGIAPLGGGHGGGRKPAGKGDGSGSEKNAGEGSTGTTSNPGTPPASNSNSNT
jgi:hypothetical protein